MTTPTQDPSKLASEIDVLEKLIANREQLLFDLHPRLRSQGCIDKALIEQVRQEIGVAKVRLIGLTELYKAALEMSTTALNDLKLPTFEGKPGECFVTFLEEWDRKVVAKGMTDQQKCTALPAYLVGNALDKFSSLERHEQGHRQADAAGAITESHKDAYQCMCAALKNALVTSKSAKLAQQAWMRARQTMSQSVGEYWRYLLSLARASCPTVADILQDGTMKELIMTRFILSLRPKLRDKVLDA